jgi:ABC-type dipeptide/oligopeptide/nickel transport system permease component
MGGMGSYLLTRLAQIVPIVLIIIVINFFLIHLAPGDPIAYIIGDAPVPEEIVAQLRQKFGLDQPLLTQLGIYLWGVVRGDFGYSYVAREPVLDIVLARLPATLLLTVSQYILAIVLGIGLGVVSARRQNWAAETATTLISVVGYAVPVFFLGQMLILVFSFKLGLFPSQGMYSLRYDMTPFASVVDVAWHLVLPCITLAFFNLALIARLTRANMLQTLRLEYLMFARSKGISESAVLYRHALRNAILPVVTIIGANIKTLIAGAVLTETVFAWPGIGRLTYEALTARDYPILMAMFVFVGILVVVANLLTDLAYAYLDPRIRYQ